MKIAVTGAAGFVGTNIVNHLSKNNEVFSLCKNINSWKINTHQNIIKLDITNREKTLEVIRSVRPDVLIHCAVYGGYPLETDVRRVVDTNVYGSINVFDACSSVPLVVNTGSSSEYGIKHDIMKESDAIAPNTDYGMTKALETKLAGYGKFKAITLRLFSVYGYYENRQRLIPSILYSSIKGEPVELSNPNNVRDFIFIEDVCNAYDAVLRSQDVISNGEIFNVGSGSQTSINELVKLVGINAKWDQTKREKEPDRMWMADISKIEQVIKWRPKYSLYDGLMKTRKWIEENVTQYEN